MLNILQLGCLKCEKFGQPCRDFPTRGSIPGTIREKLHHGSLAIQIVHDLCYALKLEDITSGDPVQTDFDCDAVTFNKLCGEAKRREVECGTSDLPMKNKEF